MNRVRFLVLLIAAGLLSFGSSCDSGGGDWATTLSGTVFDSATGLPLAGVLIYVNDTTILAIDSGGTHSTGAFELGGFGYWEHETLFRRDGYRPKDTVLGTLRYRSDVGGVKIFLIEE